MKSFGYPLNADADEPIPLSEVSVVATVKAMREMATFLSSCADEMDSKRKPYGPDTHFHFQDFSKHKVDADLIVVPVPEQA